MTAPTATVAAGDADGRPDEKGETSALPKPREQCVDKDRDAIKLITL